MTEVAEQISPTELTRPEKLTGQQTKSLMSSVGKYEIGAITLILMRSGDVFGSDNLYNQIIEGQGENKGWVMGSSNMPSVYCKRSLFTAGLVEKGILKRNDKNSLTYGFSITEYGKVGVAFAGLMLDLSERYSVPLSKLSEGIGQNIRYGISQNFPQEEIPAYKNMKVLSNLVLNVLKSNSDKFLTAEEVCVLLPAPEDVINEYKNISKVKLIENISQVLLHLNKNSYVTYSFETKSKFNVSKGQGAPFNELLEIINEFQNQDPEIIKKGNELALAIINDPQRVSRILKRAKNASNNVNRFLREEMQKKILTILPSHPEGLTNNEIKIFLEEAYGRKFGRINILSLTAELDKIGPVSMVREGNVRKFFPINQSVAWEVEK